MLSMFLGFFKSYALYAVVAGVMLSALLFAKHQYDANIISGIAAQQSAIVLMQERSDNAAIIAGLQQRTITAEADAARYASIKVQIANAKSSQACASSPAMRAALSGLRSQTGGSH